MSAVRCAGWGTERWWVGGWRERSCGRKETGKLEVNAPQPSCFPDKENAGRSVRSQRTWTLSVVRNHTKLETDDFITSRRFSSCPVSRCSFMWELQRGKTDNCSSIRLVWMFEFIQRTLRNELQINEGNFFWVLTTVKLFNSAQKTFFTSRGETTGSKPEKMSENTGNVKAQNISVRNNASGHFRKRNKNKKWMLSHATLKNWRGWFQDRSVQKWPASTRF